jgi:carbon monoxide dehydrogenase subunit G
MASIKKEVVIDATADHVWSAMSDFGAVDSRVACGFVTACKLDGEARIVTFANGTSARELLVDLDDTARRLVYTIVGSERLKHHNASFQVLAEGEGRCRVVWTADLLPAEIAPYIDAQMDLGVSAMKSTLSRKAA